MAGPVDTTARLTQDARRPIKRRRDRMIHLLVFLTYSGIWTAYVVWSQWTHFVARCFDVHDTGLVADLVYRSSVYGEFLSSPICGGSHLGTHINPTILLLAPFLWISPSGWGLIWGNVAVLVLGAIPCALLCWRITRHPMLVHVVVVWYLTNRATLANLRCPHFELLFCPLVLWMIYAAYRRWWWLYGLMLVLVLGVREDFGLPAVVFGVWLAFRGHRICGLATALVSMSVPIVAALWILPQFGTEGAGIHKWSEYGRTWAEIWLHWLMHPAATWRRLFDSGLPSLLASTAGIILLSPIAALTTVVSVFISAMSNEEPRRALVGYQTAAALPWMAWGMSLGLRQIVTWWRMPRRGLNPKYYRMGLNAVIILAFIVPLTTAYGMFARQESLPLHWRISPLEFIADRDLRVFKYLRESLPAEASVATHSNLYPLIRYRRGLTTLDKAFSCHFVVIDTKGRFMVTTQQKAREILGDLHRSRDYRLIHEDDGFYVFERIEMTPPGPSKSTEVQRRTPRGPADGSGACPVAEPGY